jgi:glycosyltransferase involved in cell wall biosynthesis
MWLWPRRIPDDVGLCRVGGKKSEGCSRQLGPGSVSGSGHFLDVSGVRFVAPMLKRLRNGSLQQGRSNVVLGAHMARRLRDEGVPADRITVIENWADGEVIQPVPKEDNPLLCEWRLEGKFVLGYSGNMGHVHEFKTMIDAAERLQGEPEIAFVFIGDGIARE